MNIPPEILWGIGAFFAAKIVEYLLGLIKKQDDIQESTIESLKEQVQIQIEVTRELRYEIKRLSDVVSLVPKLSQDISKAHSAIKEIKLTLPKNQ